VLQVATGFAGTYAAGSLPGEPAINQLAGINIALDVLGAMNPNSPYGTQGQTVQDQINQLSQQKSATRERISQVDPLFPAMTDQDWIGYANRVMSHGEANADQWLIVKHL
jgi:hypothetical protein